VRWCAGRLVPSPVLSIGYSAHASPAASHVVSNLFP
jgi:hypothetical protein